MLATPTHAAKCASGDSMKALLEQRHEEPIRRGLKDQNSLMEWWESPEGNFTIVQRLSNGQFCEIVRGAYGHEVIAPPAEPEGDPT